MVGMGKLAEMVGVVRGVREAVVGGSSGGVVEQGR